MDYTVQYYSAGESYADTISGLRDAVREVCIANTAHCDGIEGVSCDSSHGAPRWVTVYHAPDFRTGERESRTLFIPSGVRASSAKRIARLCGAQS